MLGIEFEPPSLQKVWGVEDSVPPVRIVVPARAYKKTRFRSRVWSSEFGVQKHPVNDDGAEDLEAKTPQHALLKPKSVLTLVVNPAISGPSLGPLSSVIFPAEFLSKGWVSHVQDPENKASQVGQMGNAPSRSLYGRIEFYEAEDDDKILRRDGDKEVDVNDTVWEKPAKCQKDSIDGAGGSDHRNKLIRGENDRAETRPNAAEEEIS